MKKFEPHYRLVRYGAATKVEKASRQQRMSDFLPPFPPPLSSRLYSFAFSPFLGGGGLFLGVGEEKRPYGSKQKMANTSFSPKKQENNARTAPRPSAAPRRTRPRPRTRRRRSSSRGDKNPVMRIGGPGRVGALSLLLPMLLMMVGGGRHARERAVGRIPTREEKERGETPCTYPPTCFSNLSRGVRRDDNSAYP